MRKQEEAQYRAIAVAASKYMVANNAFCQHVGMIAPPFGDPEGMALFQAGMETQGALIEALDRAGYATSVGQPQQGAGRGV